MTSELSVLADTLGANTAASLAFNDRKSATDILDALHAERHIVAACLYDNKGTVFAEYQRDGNGTDFAALPRREDGAHFEESSLTLYRTVLLGGEKSGAIAIISDLGALQAEIRQYTEISVVVILFSVLATYFLSSRLLRLITEPILHLAEVATRVTTNEDYAVRAIPRGEDEVGALIGSFNQMLERIQERDAALQGAKGELELRVRARTRELQLEVNERIKAEETLSEERKVLRALIDNVPDFMYVKDAESRFVVANAALARSMVLKCSTSSSRSGPPASISRQRFIASLYEMTHRLNYRRSSAPCCGTATTRSRRSCGPFSCRGTFIAQPQWAHRSRDRSS